MSANRFFKLHFAFCIFVFFLNFLPSASQALSWEEAIARVDARSERYWQRAEALGLPIRALGSGLNELHVEEHTCSILGRMLNKDALIENLEKSTNFDLQNADFMTYGMAAHSLDNWVYTAKRLLKFDNDRRIEVWNLDCVGRMGITVSASIPNGSRKTFFDVDGDTIRILGDVTPGFSEKLRNAVTSNPKVNTVALGSAGGSVYEALEAGLFIRRMGLTTTLYNNCYSACPLVFLGGVRRTIWSPYPKLGFHQMSLSDGQVVPFDDPNYSEITSYVRSMGADSEYVLNQMFAADPSQMNEPDHVEFCQSRVATWVQRWCSADD